VLGLDSELGQNKSLLCVKYKKHGNRDTVQNAWENIGKEVKCEGNYSLKF
jgi:hypothetical protein